MRVFFALAAWLTLAAIGAVSAGFWGFLGVAFLYVLYYALLRPRVNVHVTPQDLAELEARQAAVNAAILGRAARAIAPRTEQLSSPPPASPPSRPPARPADDNSPYWDCACGTRNAMRISKCRKCDAWNPN